MTTMRTVSIESPLAGDVRLHMLYARAAVHNALERGEAPFASHLLYTQVLDDETAEERALGIRAGLAVSARCDVTAVYMDLGISEGMRAGIREATRAGRPVVHRSIAAWSKAGPVDVPSSHDLEHLPDGTRIRLGNKDHYEYFLREHDGWYKQWNHPRMSHQWVSSLTIRTAALGEHDGLFMVVPAI